MTTCIGCGHELDLSKLHFAVQTATETRIRVDPVPFTQGTIRDSYKFHLGCAGEWPAAIQAHNDAISDGASIPDTLEGV